MIELKKEFIIKNIENVFCEKENRTITVNTNTAILHFSGLLSYLVRSNEDYHDKISNYNQFKLLYNYIVRYFTDILSIEISDIVIEEGNDYYNTIIELIEDF